MHTHSKTTAHTHEPTCTYTVFNSKADLWKAVYLAVCSWGRMLTLHVLVWFSGSEWNERVLEVTELALLDFVMFTWGMQLIFWVKEMCSIRADWSDPVTISVPSTTNKYLYILSYPSPSAILSNNQDKMEHAYYRMRYLSHSCNMTYHNAEFKTNSSVKFSSVSKASKLPLQNNTDQQC